MPTSGEDATVDTTEDAGDEAAGDAAEPDTSDPPDEAAESDAGDPPDEAAEPHAENGVDRAVDDAETALSAAIEDADGHPTCALCPKSADYFLYETDHVAKFVCWEHVSPHSAAVDGEDARPGRPLALSL